jgi:hypothetical protein
MSVVGFEQNRVMAVDATHDRFDCRSTCGLTAAVRQAAFCTRSKARSERAASPSGISIGSLSRA